MSKQESQIEEPQIRICGTKTCNTFRKLYPNGWGECTQLLVTKKNSVPLTTRSNRPCELGLLPLGLNKGTSHLDNPTEFDGNGNNNSGEAIGSRRRQRNLRSLGL